MQEVVTFLTENPVQYLSTVGADGRPKVRPFQFMLAQDGRLYFCTANTKDVYAEMTKNPYVELCVSSAQFVWLRLSGKAVFSKDIAVKEAVIASSPLVKSIYQTADNPAFEIFYLDGVQAVISDFSGSPPKSYTF